jgi:hypothetical protein
MVSRNLNWVLVALAFGALGAPVATGCVRAPQEPDPWTSLPVVVAGADAASFTLRIDEKLTLGGKEVDEVADKARWKTKMPEALRERIEQAGFKVVGATDPADLVMSIQTNDVEWTGRFWDAKGNVGVVLAAPIPDTAMVVDGGAPPPDQAPVARASAKFKGIDFPVIADAVASSIADQLARSAELAQWIKAKRDKEEAAKAPPPLPTPPPAPPPVKGLEESEIKPVLIAMRPAFRGCYDAVLVNNPGLTGTLALKIAIQPSGSVESVGTDAASSLNDTGLSTCVAEVTKAATFPKAEGPSTYTYPIEFTADTAPEVNKGGLEAVEVQKGIRSAHDKMRNCFEAGVKKEPGFSGIVKIKFSIDQKGKPINASIAKDSPLKDGDVPKCVLEVVKGTTFSKPKKWTEVVYPIEFRAR